MNWYTKAQKTAGSENEPVAGARTILHNLWSASTVNLLHALLAITEKIAHTQVGYWSYTTDLTACKQCFTNMPGLHDTCYTCNSTEVEHYSRITGYYQAVSGWNAGKQQELKDRYRYQLEELD